MSHNEDKSGSGQDVPLELLCAHTGLAGTGPVPLLGADQIPTWLC